uniref:Ubiquitin-like protease family profile domain-containing protein n=1 Tax=Chenopodium quinoa TaxID=63459 RepID=A0A803LH78_CHEQI
MVKKKVSGDDNVSLGSIKGFRYSRVQKAVNKMDAGRKKMLKGEGSTSKGNKRKRQEKEDDEPDRKITCRCRPSSLVKVISGLSPTQKKDVEEVGFGGLLSLRVESMVGGILPWLVESFNGYTCMFCVADGKEFVVTKHDVCDVFGLPKVEGREVPEMKGSYKGQSQDDSALKNKWRASFDVGVKELILLARLETRIKELVDGGDEFKRLFVMHALSSMLVPTANRTVNFRLVNAVDDVDQIKNLDWCSFVLRKLMNYVVSYKNSEAKDSISGCLLLLKIMYFHRLNFQGVVENSTIPLIQHWTDKKVRNRVSLELKAGGFGQGVLNELTYPVSAKCVDLNVNNLSKGEGCAVPIDDDRRCVTFDLPEGVLTDSEIKSAATDDLHEAFLYMKRNMELFSSVNSNCFSSLQRLVHSRFVEHSVSLDADSIELSQTQQLLSNPHYHKLIDGLIDEFIKMKSVDELLKVDASTSSKSTLQDGGDGGGGGGRGGSVRRTNKSLCSLDCGEIGGQSVVLVTPFMKSNSRAFSEKLPRLYLEALDYCLVEHLFNNNENLVTYGLHFLIPREDMVSLVHPNLFAFLQVSEGNEDSSASSVVSDLHEIWDEWVTYENSCCDVIGADLVYFPILVDEHYVMFVIDHGMNWFIMLIISFGCSEFGDFLARRNHPKSEKVPFYKFKIADLVWRKSKVDNNDCGVYMMCHMEHFVGDTSFSVDELRTVSDLETDPN